MVDEDKKLLGCVTDGDIRRGLLHGHNVETPVNRIMQAPPHTLPVGTPRKNLLDTMQAYCIKQIPLVTPMRQVMGVAFYDMLTGFEPLKRDNPVVIMAGAGWGVRRLRRPR